jgi:peptidoglycan hydrolase-like protein with peptidoglycan-binding domain
MKLHSLGFYNGEVDGSWGSGSKAALRAWKKSVGLPNNDTWDRATESRLME